MLAPFPVVELFDDALGRPKVSVGHFSLWANRHGRPRHQVYPKLLASVLRPANDATLSGVATLGAAATDYLQVEKVQFRLNGGDQHDTLIGVGHLTLGGWIARWNTASLADGTYTVQSVAYDAAGTSSVSNNITVTVRNSSAATAVWIRWNLNYEPADCQAPGESEFQCGQRGFWHVMLVVWV